MTGLIIFLWPGSSEQLAIALFVTLASLVYVLKVMPFANARIGTLQGAMLAAQSATLFIGLLLYLDSLRKELRNTETSFYDRAASAVILVLLSTVIFLLPPITLAYDNRREIQKYLFPNTLRHNARRKTKRGADGRGADASAAAASGLRRGSSDQDVRRLIADTAGSFG
eukprot:3932784-Rhodomonas_salina.2